MGDTEITRDMVTEWEYSLKAGRKSPATVKIYADGLRAYLDYAAAAGVPAVLTRRGVDAFSVHLTDERGNKDATVASRQLALRRFSAWARSEGLIEVDHLATYTPIRPKPPVMEPLTTEELQAMLAACKPLTTLRAARDDALIRLMAETGLRAGECAGLSVADVDAVKGTAQVRQGKGGKHRLVGYGAQTSQALLRYLRYRNQHALAQSSTKLWLGDRGREFTYDALHKALAGRARAAGITRFHPHLLRNTFAHRWLEQGGSTPALMAQGGWTSLEMVQRYARYHENTRAVAEAQRLNLGDV